MSTKSTQQNKGFSSKIGFILAAAGSAIGLGNLWRFPWQVGKYGGGAFVFTYIFMVLLLGMPILISEILLGRNGRDTVLDSYGKVNKNLKWLGFLAILVPFFITSYYTVIGGWSIKYALNYIVEPSFAKAGATDYFVNFITSSYVAPLFSLIFIAITIYIVARGVDKGIEKAGKVLMPALAIIVVLLAIIALSNSNQEGVRKGMKYYLGSFNIKALGYQGVIAAMSQAFFSLSLGMGIMVAYGSYTNKKVNVGKSALTIALLDTLFALIAGIIIYSSVYVHIPDAKLDQLAGAGLVFMVLPEIFSSLGGFGQFFGFAFFVLVAFAALTSLISLLEVVSQYTIKRFKLPRRKATVLFGGLAGIISIFVSLSQNGVLYQMFGFDMLTYLDEITNTVLLPIIGAMSAITIGWFMKKQNIFKMLEETESTVKYKKIWLFATRYLAVPLSLVVLVMGIYGNFNKYAAKKQNYGFILLGASIMIIVSIIANILWNSEKYNNFIENKRRQRMEALMATGEETTEE